MKKILFTLLVLLLFCSYSFGQVADSTGLITGDTIITTSHLKNKPKQELCSGWEAGANGGLVFSKVYNDMVWVKNVTNDPYNPMLRYKTAGTFSARVAYHYWHLSLAAVYNYISEISYNYGTFNKDLVYYFGKPIHMFGLSGNFHTRFGLYGGVNSSYVHFDYGNTHTPRVSYNLPDEPSKVVRAVTIGVQVGYTYTFYKGLGANAEVGMNNIPLKVNNVRLFYFPLTMGLRYRFD